MTTLNTLNKQEKFIEKKRVTVLKGNVYTMNSGLMIMCTKTSCSLTSSYFKGVVVGYDNYKPNEYNGYLVGDTSKKWKINRIEKP